MLTRQSALRSLAAAIAVTAALYAPGRHGYVALAAQSALDRALSEYRHGDYQAVARTFNHPQSFQRLDLLNRRRFDNWLGTWDRTKAALVLELANQATRVAPVYTRSLLGAGREYVMRRAMADQASSSEDDFMRLWHRIAVGLLERHGLALSIEEYIGAMERLPGPSDRVLPDARLLLARGIAQEQRCAFDSPSLQHPGARVDEVTRAARAPAAGLHRSQKTLDEEESQQRACLAEAAARFAAAAVDDALVEARIREAWVLFQLGRSAEAFRQIETVTPAGDRDLAYWALLFRARIETALGRDGDAERSYRAALAICPRAQSAGVGLVLALFRMDRAAEADAIARDVWNQSGRDPWWLYIGADQRFVDLWIDDLRGRLQ